MMRKEGSSEGSNGHSGLTEEIPVSEKPVSADEIRVFSGEKSMAEA
jgi:hypothetical protein